MDERVHLKLDRSAASAVDAYFEYRSIVGDDDNGRLFTPEEYENYKKTVLPMRQKNRLYVSWTNSRGVDCKLVGPETQCMCQHRYKQHKTDFDAPVSGPSALKCKVAGCDCSGFHYVPKNGNQALRCHCKHLTPDHRGKSPHACRNAGCKCAGFQTSFRCGCSELSAAHTLIIETRDERLKRGHPVAREEPPFAAMGGLTGMSSLIDGYMRLDDSGIGAPSREFLEQPSSSSHHHHHQLPTQPMRNPKGSAGRPRQKTISKRPPWNNDL